MGIAASPRTNSRPSLELHKHRAQLRPINIDGLDRETDFSVTLVKYIMGRGAVQVPATKFAGLRASVNVSRLIRKFDAGNAPLARRMTLSCSCSLCSIPDIDITGDVPNEK